MTERQIENRIKKLQVIEAQQKALEKEVEELKTEIKADLEAKGIDEIKTASFVVKWKEIISNRLDGKALKDAFPEIYNQYCKKSASRRFTIA